MAALLSIRNLQVHFQKEDYSVRAVDGLDYDLNPGSTLAVVGESGSGKTVHALTILRLLPSAARIAGGEILFHGKNLLSMSPKDIQEIRGNHIAMIFQEPMTSLNPVMRVVDQIAEGVLHHKKCSPAEALDKAANLLKKVGIPAAEERIYDYPHQFSGGMCQRVMIAMALSCGPDILIADEPTTALDVTIQAQILELLKNLQNEFKMALILITHNLGVVAGMADEVVVMYAGRAVEKARVGPLFKRPLHPYTRSLLGSVPSIYARKDKLAAISGQPPELSKPFSACPFAPRCPDVFERCRAEDPPEFLLAESRMSNCWLREDEARSKRHRLSASTEIPS